MPAAVSFPDLKRALRTRETACSDCSTPLTAAEFHFGPHSTRWYHLVWDAAKKLWLEHACAERKAT